MGVKSRWSVLLIVAVCIGVIAARWKYNSHLSFDNDFLFSSTSMFFWLPLFISLFIFGQDASSFGLTPGDSRKGYLPAGIILLLLIPFLLIASHRSEYITGHPADPRALNGFMQFCRFELIYGVYLFCIEFFFRGFLLFGLERRLGWWSVLVQALAYAALQGQAGDFALALVSGLVLGILAIRSKSVLPSFALHWSVLLAFDLLVISTTHRGVV